MWRTTSNQLKGPEPLEDDTGTVLESREDGLRRRTYSRYMLEPIQEPVVDLCLAISNEDVRHGYYSTGDHLSGSDSDSPPTF